MSLILRAHVATAAQGVVPSWPLESFIAVNPLAGDEARPFETAAAADVRFTRSRDDYLRDLNEGRITAADLEAALLERTPELAGVITIGGMAVRRTHAAVLDMTSASWVSPTVANDRSSWLDDYLSAWVSSYVNPDPLWQMPHKQQGFFGAWRALARHDSRLPRAVRRRLSEVPLEPDAALAWALDQLAVPANTVTAALREELAFLPGWVAHIKWRAEKIGDIDLTSYLAVRWTVRALRAVGVPAAPVPPVTVDPAAAVWSRADAVAAEIVGPAATREDTAALARVLAWHPVSAHPFTWQKAYELHYRAALLPALIDSDPADDPPELQVVMCIDPRSEGMRRHLERAPAVETFGFAGFFGVPVRFARYGARSAVNSLPALLSPRHQVTEQPTAPERAERVVARGRNRDAVRTAVHSADSSTATPFAFAETTGWLYGATSVLRTFTPTLHARLGRGLAGSRKSLDTTVAVADAFSLDERAAIAETGVRMMGMSLFAPLVILAGHSSESTNNLYESALDCGACGGNPGAANARSAAAIFNDPDVRALLRARGIDIPESSFFVGAEHNTVTDSVDLLDRHLIPESHRQLAQRFEQVQGTAADELVRERANDLPGASARKHPSRVRRRAHDWAEVYPELGLAGNAAMIIGPRRMTRGVDLGRRVFLHSYETMLDPNGTALETIMTAPLVVAQWINHQYYFSALNPTTLGAGTKTIHNAVGTIGVLAGHSGDLRRGLPWQSVGIGSRLFHEPLRLAVIIEAPLDRVGGIVSRNQVLRNLFDNDWITLTARDDRGSAWHRYTPYGWKSTPAMEGQYR